MIAKLTMSKGDFFYKKTKTFIFPATILYL